MSRPPLGSTEPISWVPGPLIAVSKAAGRQADRLPPSSAVVKKTRMYTFIPHTPLSRSAKLSTWDFTIFTYSYKGTSWIHIWCYL
jgi:hypothetical protein